MGNPLANLTLTKIAKRLIEVEEAAVDAPSTGADETIDGDWNFTGAVTRNGVTVETTTGAQFKANAAEQNAKAYIDALLADNPITNVRGASVANVDLSAPGSTIDGVSLVNGDRVLISDQSTGSENGIYVWNGAASAMTRAADFDTSGEIPSGLIVSVAEGTVNEASIWQLVTSGTITLDTTALDFEIKAGAAAGFALDADVLHKAGTETIPGDKNFTGALNKGGAAVETVTGAQAKADAVNTALTAEVSRAIAAEATKAADSATVHKTGNETVAGIKTFSSSPVVPTPQGATDAATKGYVDTQRGTAANDADVLHLAGTETVTGAKNFTGGLTQGGVGLVKASGSQGQQLMSSANGAPKWVDVEAHVDAFGADATGATDSTTAVHAAVDYLVSVATANGLTNLGRLVFGPGKYQFGGIAPGQKSIIVQGSGAETTVLQPRSATETMFTFGSSAGYTLGSMLLDLTLKLPFNMAYSVPVTDWKLCRSFRVDDVELDGDTAGSTGWCGKFIKMHSCYEGTFGQVRAQRGKYCVPIDIDVDMVNPASGIIDQCDTIKFEHFVSNMCCGVIVRGAAPGQSGGDMHGLQFDNFKAQLLYYDNSHVPNFSTTLSASAAAGDTTITVMSVGGTSPAGIQAGDMITIGAKYNIEVAKVNSVAGNVLTLLRPLEYAHAITDTTNFNRGVPVVLGGFGISLGNNVSGVHFNTIHAERQAIFALVGSGKDITFDNVYMGASVFASFYDSVQGVRFGNTWMCGTTVNNRLFAIPSWYTNQTQSPSYIRVDGPIVQLSGASVTMNIVPTAPGVVGYGAWESNELTGSNRVPLTRKVAYTATDTSPTRLVQRLNGGGNGYATTVQELSSGQVYYTDGVATIWLGAIDGLTSAQLDALFAASPANLPNTVTLAAAGTSGGNVVKLLRRGGSGNKWQVSATYTQIA